MKMAVNPPVGIGFLLVLLAGPIFGQVPNQVGPEPQPVNAPVSPQGPLASSTSKPHDDRFVIGSGDRLAVNVWKEQDLTRTIPVRSDGKISLPLVGEVQAAGRTPLQLEQDIAARLRNYVTDPEVTVIVEQINSEKFNILGQVGKPGSYPLLVTATVVDAIAMAGGFKDFAKQKAIYILRQTPDGKQSRIGFNYKEFIKGKNPSQNVRLEPNDTIIVP
jgi:polysaccharide export outer membrane protein